MNGPVPAVDVHAHVTVPAVEALIADEPGHAEQQRIDAVTAGDASIAYNRTHFRQLIPRLADLDVRLAAMDKASVDIQAVTPVPQSHAWAGRVLAERIVAVTNEAVAGFCARQPSRLLPMGTVALQHPDLAVVQLRRLPAQLHRARRPRVVRARRRPDNPAATQRTAAANLHRLGRLYA
jgi:predicted TIM-barrel fold metal-dependent hydrolase